MSIQVYYQVKDLLVPRLKQLLANISIQASDSTINEIAGDEDESSEAMSACLFKKEKLP